MKIATAQSRIRSNKGSSFLTHGSDNYDHKGLKKARRELDQALIEEGMNDMAVQPVITQKSITHFRLVLWTQIYENYGAHCWDGEGDCPQHWKAKGGEEYHVQIGTVNRVMELGSKGIQAIVDRVLPMIQTNNESWSENVIGWELFSDAEETIGEQDERQAKEWGYTSRFITTIKIEV